MRELRAIDAQADPQPPLFAHLADGLHAMAQPLTILRGALGAMCLRDTIAPGDRRYLEMSSIQIDRLCGLMCNLRTLIDVAQFPLTCTSFDLRELVERILEDSQTVQLEMGVRIAARAKAPAARVFADRVRIEQALTTAFSTAVSLSSRGDVIQCRIDSDDAVVRLVLQNKNRQEKDRSSADRLALSLIEACLDGQRGACLLTEKPLCLSITLPLALPAQAAGYITSDCLKTAV